MLAPFAFAALLALAGVSAIDGRARPAPPGRERWHRPLPGHVTASGRGVVAAAAATYLLELPPLPNFVSDVVVALRLLLDVPRGPPPPIASGRCRTATRY